MFVVNHFLGDPVDTVYNLFVKMSDCQYHAEGCKKRCAAVFEPAVDENMASQEASRGWKALAIIVDALSESGDQDFAAKAV